MAPGQQSWTKNLSSCGEEAWKSSCTSRKPLHNLIPCLQARGASKPLGFVEDRKLSPHRAAASQKRQWGHRSSKTSTHDVYTVVFLHQTTRIMENVRWHQPFTYQYGSRNLALKKLVGGRVQRFCSQTASEIWNNKGRWFIYQNGTRLVAFSECRTAFFFFCKVS